MGPNAELARQTIAGEDTRGIPTWMVHIMQHSGLERLAGTAPGSYSADPETIYLTAQRRAGVCMIDQYLATNPLDMGDRGYEATIARGVTSGVDEIVCDGIAITSPEAVVEHLERFVWPALRRQIREFNEDQAVRRILDEEARLQQWLGPDILKVAYGDNGLPGLRYWLYGYEGYFTAYALYPEIMERDFQLQADLAVLQNRALARAYREGDLPSLCRVDHDMASAQGLLVDVRSLDRIWFPAFARALQPLLDAPLKLIWHCDGNLMDMVPRLLELGFAGFQGFQYECGMDYKSICALRTREGEELTIIAGASVTRTLPFGSPADVRRELDWLVENGPRRGMFLGASSSITPGVPWENLQALVEGLTYYREHGR